MADPSRKPPANAPGPWFVDRDNRGKASPDDWRRQLRELVGEMGGDGVPSNW